MKIPESVIQTLSSLVKGVIVAAFVISPAVVGADVPGEQVPEVEHLLNFVKSSGCEMNRNGTYHTGEEAVAHIQQKYDYFRDRINTTEDFIEYSATKSTMSGKYYTVRCGDAQEVATQSWLLNELKSYRAGVGQAQNKL